MLSNLLKSFKENIVLILVSIIAAIMILKYIQANNDNKRLHENLIDKKEKLVKINEYAANLERKYVTQKKLKEEIEKNWKDEKEQLKGRIKVLSNATFLIREKARVSGKSDLVYKGKRMKYVVNEIKYNNGPPVGYVLIFDDGRVTSRLYNHTIEVKTAVSRDEDSGRYNVVSKADYVLKSPSLSKTGNWFNKPFPLKIKGGTALIDPTEPINKDKRFYYWAPSYNLNANISPSGILPGLGVSVMGYGESRRDLDYKFLQFGAQSNDSRGLGLTFTPVMYRPFRDKFSNTYIGPGVSIDETGNRYFLGIQVGL